MIKANLKLENTLSETVEMQLLLTLLRNSSSGTKNNDDVRHVLSEKIDWDYLIRLAKFHKINPLILSLKTKSINANFTPTCFFDELKKQHFLASTQSIIMTKELINVIEVLKEHQIPTIAFKGPVLASCIYGNISARTFGDLDILVHSRDFLKTREILIQKGCLSSINYLVSSEKQERKLISAMGECTLIGKGGKIFIDLHQRLDAGGFFRLSHDFEDVWDNLTEIKLLNYPVQTLSVENLLIYLCMHGTKSLWNRLSLIYDISELIGRYSNLSWSYILQRVKITKTDQMLFLGLTLARDLMNAPLPGDVETAINEDFRCQSLLERTKRKLLYKPLTSQEQDPNYLKQFIFRFQTLSCFQDRWSCIVTLLQCLIYPTQNDREFLKLPKKIYFLYYFIRPFRLFGTFFNHRNWFSIG